MFTDSTGKTLQKRNDQVRLCVSHLESVGDAAALEKYYHITCLRSAQRTFIDTGTCAEQHDALIHSLCQEDLISSVQNSLDDGACLDMSQVNYAYIVILKKTHNLSVRIGSCFCPSNL